MAFLKLLAAGILGAALASGVWIAIAIFASEQAAWMALLVGLAAGLGVRKASASESQWRPGLAAGLSALTVILVAQGIVAEMSTESPPNDFFDNVTLVSEELMIAYVADDIALEWEAEGRTLEWPRDITWEDAVFREDYPADLWDAAADDWHAMPAEAQERLMQERKRKAEEIQDSFRRQLRDADAQDGTGGADLVWLTLAVLLAIGAGAWRVE